MLEAVYFGTGCVKATTKEPESLCMEEYILQEKQHAKMVKIYYLNSLDKSSIIVKCCQFLNRKLATKISKLDVHHNNKLQTEGTVNVCLALKYNYNLRCFSLENNEVGDEAADTIAAVYFLIMLKSSNYGLEKTGFHLLLY